MDIGDKLVCVDDDFQQYTYKLEKYKYYTLKEVVYDFKTDYTRYFLIEEAPYRFSPDRFIPLKRYRKEKLQKISEYESRR